VCVANRPNSRVLSSNGRFIASTEKGREIACFGPLRVRVRVGRSALSVYWSFWPSISRARVGNPNNPNFRICGPQFTRVRGRSCPSLILRKHGTVGRAITVQSRYVLAVVTPSQTRAFRRRYTAANTDVRHHRKTSAKRCDFLLFAFRSSGLPRRRNIGRSSGFVRASFRGFVVASTIGTNRAVCLCSFFVRRVVSASENVAILLCCSFASLVFHGVGKPRVFLASFSLRSRFVRASSRPSSGPQRRCWPCHPVRC